MNSDEPMDGPPSRPEPLEGGAGGGGGGVSAGAWGDSGAEDDAPSGPPSQHPFAHDEAHRYARGGLLGEGGMGRVWAAQDARLGRAVALKEARAGSGLSVRLAREAQITAQLDHPGIVTVLDAGESAEGQPFYTMQLVRGRSLGEAIAEAPDLSARLRLLRRVLDACQAIAHAHHRGIIHRDLKPDNLMLGEFGGTRVVDWGLARRVGEQDLGAPESPARSPALTRVGAVMGTPAWMSPEQAVGHPADTRSDVWSLGAILYALVSGSAPREGDALVPLRERCPEAPPELLAIVSRAMAAAPEARYADAGELVNDLAAYVDGRRVEAHEYGARELLVRFIQAYRAPLSVAGVAVLLLSVAIAVGWWGASQERDRALRAEQEARGAEAETRSALAGAYAQQALSAAEDLSRTEAELFAANALALEESPDARGVLAAFSGPRPQLIERREGLDCAGAWFSPGGDLYVCSQGASILMRQREPARVLWSREGFVQGLAFSSDGAEVWIVDQQADWIRLRSDTGELLASGRHHADVFTHGVRASRGWLYGLNGYELRGSGPSGEETLQHLCLQQGGVMAPLPDGRLYALCNDGEAWSWEPREPLCPSTPVDWGDELSWSRRMRVAPDGATAIVVRGGDGQVAVVDISEGRLLALLPVERGDLIDVAISKDGRFAAVLGEAGGVRVLDIERTSWLGGLPSTEVEALTFAPDGTLLTLGVGLDRWRMPPAAPVWQLRTGHGQADLAFSEDGSQIAVATGEGALEVFDRDTGVLLWRALTPNHSMKWVAALPDNQGWALASMGFQGVRRYAGDGGLIDALVWSQPSTARRVIADGDGALLILPHSGGLLHWSAEGEGTQYPGTEDERAFVNAVADPQSGRVLVSGMSGAAYLWSLERGLEPLVTGRVINGVGLLPGGERAVFASDEGLELFDIARGETLWTLSVQGERPYRLAVSPDGRWAAVGDLAGGVRVWSLEERSLKIRLRGHDQRVASLDFSSDSRWLASASWDGTARLWDLSVIDREAASLLEEIEGDWGLGVSALLETGSLGALE